MAIPCKATGAGNNSTARNVLSATFSTALSAAPTYELYDNSYAGTGTPSTGTATTTANSLFGGAGTPWMSLVDTSSGAPSSAWKPGSATAGSATANRMKGTTNYVTSTATPGAGGRITWNMVLEVPSTATTSSTTGHDLLLRYTYTGAAPTVAWFVNEGTEGTPTWTAFTPGTHVMRHCQSGSGSGVYNMPIPAAATSDSAEIWVTV